MRLLGCLSFTLILMTMISCEAMGQASSSTVVIGAQVSQAVFLSIAPGTQVSDDNLRVAYSVLDSHSVFITISITGNDVGRISIPVQLRSNVGYTLSASASFSGATLSGLRLTSSRATGKFVTPDAVQAANMACEASNARVQMRNANQATPEYSSPTAVMTGPRISLTGPVNSPFNAVEVIMLAEVEPQHGQETRYIELILSASPNTSTPTLIAKR